MIDRPIHLCVFVPPPSSICTHRCTHSLLPLLPTGPNRSLPSLTSFFRMPRPFPSRRRQWADCALIVLPAFLAPLSARTYCSLSPSLSLDRVLVRYPVSMRLTAYPRSRRSEKTRFPSLLGSTLSDRRRQCTDALGSCRIRQFPLH